MPNWTRMGECCGCGDCCRQSVSPVALILPIKDEVYGRIRFGEPVQRRADGTPVFAISGPLLFPCPQLVGDGCRMHTEKPATCREFPHDPNDLLDLPRCTYSFLDFAAGLWADHRGIHALTERSDRDDETTSTT